MCVGSRKSCSQVFPDASKQFGITRTDPYVFLPTEYTIFPLASKQTFNFSLELSLLLSSTQSKLLSHVILIRLIGKKVNSISSSAFGCVSQDFCFRTRSYTKQEE